MGTLFNCILSSNTATVYGGGAYYGELSNCMLSENLADDGGGAIYSKLTNCTVTRNVATNLNGRGGICSSSLYNCIVWDNSSSVILWANHSSGVGDTNSVYSIRYSCTYPMPSGMGNITNNPLFVNATGGNYRLQTNSPCINAGNNAYAIGDYDLDGNPRIVGGTVDMGAYECQTSISE